jgi:4-hydroxybenzoate polyprenyltransferase
MRGWWELIRERFPPGSYLPLVVVFVLGNGGVAAAATGTDRPWPRFAIAGVLSLLFFFRLRCFDEIKDYRLDLVIHPTRPLPRGAVSVPAVKRAFLIIAAAELVIAATLGARVVATHALALAYSFLMYREFFIGRRIRPHLTAYAVTHTFVSVLLGYSVASVVTGRAVWELPQALLLFGLVNWCLFNLFEFARKTYAREEERADVDSYSRIFRPAGGALLSASQVAAALALLAWVSEIGWQAVAAGLLAVPLLAYAVRPTVVTAMTLRGVTGVYLLAAYALLAWRALG